MPQSINNNLVNLIGVRQANNTQAALTKALERVASGQRINSARDDAAGLQIANRFSSQISALTTASRNANDGVSFAQTVDSALEESTNTLQRIRDLSLQAANDTLSSDDRSAIQNEIDQLKEEINRIAETTSFNGRKILDGSLDTINFQIGDSADEQINLGGFNSSIDFLGGLPGSIQSEGNRASLGSNDLGTQGIQEGDSNTVAINELNLFGENIAAPNAGGSLNTVTSTTDLVSPGNLNYGSGLAKTIAERINTLSSNDNSNLSGVAAQATTTFISTEISAADYSGSVNTNTNTNVGAGAIINGDLSINGVDIGPAVFQANDRGGELTRAINQKSDLTGVTARVNDNGDLELNAFDGRDIVINTQSSAVSNRLFGGGDNRFSAEFQNLRISGAVTVSANETIEFSGSDTTQAGLDTLQQDNVVNQGSLASLSVSSPELAQQGVNTIDSALNRIDGYRASIGAIQNRFESSIRNLESIGESQSAALSRLGDTDLAAQISELSQQQIKRQAGLALQAQANALSQQVLSLLS